MHFYFKYCLAFAVWLFTGLSVSAQSISDGDLLNCRDEQDSLARLTCYDNIAATISNAEMSVGAAYTAFEKLNFFEGHISGNGPYGHKVGRWTSPESAQTWLASNWEGYLGIYQRNVYMDLSLIRQQSFLFDCYLYDERMWRIDRSSQTLASVPPEKQLVVTYEVIVPLANVDLELTRSSGGKTIVMKRGAEIFSNAYGFKGWSNFDDLLPFTSYTGAGSVAMNRNATILDLQRDRSLDVTFARAYAEDQQRAFLAFIDLAETCQR